MNTIKRASAVHQAYFSHSLLNKLRRITMPRKRPATKPPIWEIYETLKMEKIKFYQKKNTNFIWRIGKISLINGNANIRSDENGKN